MQTMTLPLLTTALAVSLTASLSAQTRQVTPSGMTNAYGGINNSIPWGPFVPTGNTTGEIMVQQIEDQLLGPAIVLQSMSFRHQYTANHVAKTFTVQVTLADAASGSALMSNTFANNFKVGGSRTIVFNGALNFPAVGSYPRPPAAFDSPVLFTTPHLHMGTDPLLWEAIIFGTTPVTPTQFYERGPGTTHTAGWVGTGCVAAGGVNPLTASGSISGTVITNSLANGPASAPALLLIGDTSNNYVGLPLPFNLAPIGSPNCDLNINFLNIIVLTTSASGTVTSSIPYTMNPGLSGSRLRTQWLSVDATLSVVTSNGLDHSFPYNATTGVRWPQNRAYANNWGTTPPLTGAIQNNGLVVEWTY